MCTFPSTSLPHETSGEITSESFERAISDLSVQDSFFKLLHASVQTADSNQLAEVFDLCFDKFVSILKIALHDIWVLLSAAAEYNALRSFLRLFKFCLLLEKLRDVFKVRFADLLPDLKKLFEICSDALQTAELSAEVLKATELFASLMFVIFAMTNPSDHQNLRSQFTKLSQFPSTAVSLIVFRSVLEEAYADARLCEGQPEGSREPVEDYGTDVECSDEEEPSERKEEPKERGEPLEVMIDFAFGRLRHVVLHTVEWTEDLHYLYLRLCNTIRDRNLGGVLEKATSTMLDIAFHFRSLPQLAESEVLRKTLETTADLIAAEPQPPKIAAFLSFCFLNSRSFHTIMKSMGSLLNDHPLQPNYAIGFPQPAHSESNQHFLRTGGIFNEAAAYFILDPVHRITANGGLTVSSWLNVKDRTVNSRLHVCSVGTSKLFASLHVNPKKNYVVARVFHQNKQVGRIKMANAFKQPNKWINFVFGLCSSESRIKVIFMLGGRFRDASYVCPGYKGDQETFAISLGAVSDEKEPPSAFELTSVFGFKGVLSTDSAVLLRAMGCARDSLTNCALTHADYSFLGCLSKALFRSKSELHKLCAKAENFMDKLHRSLLFSINAANFHAYGLSVLQQGTAIEKQKGTKEVFLFTLTQEIEINSRCPMVSYSPNRLDQTLQTVGYVKLFLFAYALSVDRGYEAVAQSEALRTLVFALKRDPMAHRVFSEMDGPMLLARILSSERAHVNEEIFATLMELVFSRLEREEGGKITITSYSAIVEPILLNTLTASAWLWKGKRFPYWTQLIRLVGDSVQKSCVLEEIKAFNIHQLEMLDFLSTLLNVLLDMRAAEDEFALGEEKEGALQLADGLNSLVRILLGTPVKPDRIKPLWNWLQLSHPPPDTMISRELKGRLDWVRPDELPLTEEPFTFQSSDLANFLNNLCDRHSKEKICERWQETNSIITIRNEFVGLPRIRSDSAQRKTSLTAFELKDLTEEMGLLDGNEITDRYLLPDDIPPEEHWIVHLRAMFLEMLLEIVWTCEDATMAVFELDVICWNSILVLLTNQRYLRIRSLIVSLLKNFFLRCDVKYRNSFAVQHGFVFLANELRKHQLDARTVDALFSLTCGEPVTIFHGLDERHLHAIVYDKFKIHSLFALFVLLEESVEDSLMFWSICSTLQKMFAGENAPRLAFFEMGLGPTMVNVLKKMCARKDGKLLNGPIFPLLDCWSSFSRTIFQLTVPYKDRRVFAFCEEFLWLCLTADFQTPNRRTARTRGSSKGDGDTVDSSTSTDSSVFCPQLPLAVAPSLALRRMLCHLLHAYIDAIRSIVADPLTVAANNFGNSFGNTSTSSGESSEFEVLNGESEWSFESVNRLERYHGAEKSKKQQSNVAPMDELIERLLFALERTNGVFIFLRPTAKVSDEEEALFSLHLELLLAAWKSKANSKTDEWTQMLAACKNRASSLLGELIAFVMYAARQKIAVKSAREEWSTVDHQWALIRRLRLAQLLASELPLNRLNLVALLETNLDYQYALKVAVHELTFLFANQQEVAEFDEDLDKLARFLRSIQINSPLALLTSTEIESLGKDEELLVQLYQEKEREFLRYLQAKTSAIQSGEVAFLAAVADKATRLTCELAEIQSPLRRKTLQWKKAMESALAKTSETICHLMRELCHPESVFFDQHSWPKGFALDTTENVKRERRRLKPASYNFPAKFLRNRQLAAEHDGACPLSNLLEGSLSRSALERVEASSQIRRSLSVTLIRTAFECSGEIVMSDTKLFFLGDNAKSTQKGRTYTPVSYAWAFEQIREIHNRFYLLKDTALELFTTTGDAFLIVFSDADQRRMLLEHLAALNFGALIVDREAQLSSANKMWRKGQISNFDYLMILNKLAGRSFNDLMQYPVFPFILSDYTSEFLNLTSSQAFRDLSRPMAIQDRSMEQTYVRMFNSLIEECNRSAADGGFPSLHMGPYHYGSHYSNTGIVAYFLVRVLPYTNIALEYQGKNKGEGGNNNFDIPDRLFNSIQNTWRLSSSESTTDFKELIPEFFFFPEMFQNREHLELGIRQNGQPADDVHLPPWCPDGNARLFCLIHRQALESPMVTVALHDWIDLIFGYKQQGDAAVKAVNLFHPSTYRGRDLESEGGGDELYVNAVRTMIRTYGQMPVQLFAVPHLPHFTANRSHSLNQVENVLLSSVRGIRFGDFLGSPDTDDRLAIAPTCVFQLEEHERIDHLTALNHDGGLVCYGMLESTAMIIKYKSDREDALRRNFEFALTAVISWRFPDRILRIKLIQQDDDSCWVNLLDLRSLTVAKIAFSPSNDTLYIGFTNGLIKVYTLTYKAAIKQWKITVKSELFAHKSTISSLNVSDNFHVLLSTSLDGNVCLWDTNRLEFVRKLELTRPVRPVEEVVTLSCISPISCDVAVVSESAVGSRASLYTVNGDAVGTHREDEKITSVAMTSLDEGTGVNCLFLGLERGIIRVLEMWTMNTLRVISDPHHNQSPVISMHFTNDSRCLYAALGGGSGVVLCWQSASLSRTKAQPVFKMLNPFL